MREKNAAATEEAECLHSNTFQHLNTHGAVMPGSKRSLAPTFFPERANDKRTPPPPLNEGFAIPNRRPIPVATPKTEGKRTGGNPKPYGRGSAALALEHITDPAGCSDALAKEVSANTSKGPLASRRELWSQLATKAGHARPFCLDPDLIYQVMGALKLANFRSAQLYLDAAKSQHIADGHPWTAQLQQCYRAAVRSCNRNIGNPKQAAPLPLLQLADIQTEDALVPQGPKWPARSTLLASWWLLREIEASQAQRQHVEVDENLKKIAWRLPSSKTDWKALGATRCHSCSCEFAPTKQCPYHCMVAQLESIGKDAEAPIFPSENGQPASKQGWADTFQCLAEQLGIPLTYQNGARKFTGHSARATGAVFLASTQVELWRIQLFGRWGSQVFLQYLRDAPLGQLDQLSLETSVHLSMATAKAQLQDMLRQAKHDITSTLACPMPAMIEDCEAAALDLPEPKPSDVIIRNCNGGKIHRALDYDELTHPKEWRTRCSWHFGLHHTSFEIIDEHPSDKTCCLKCFPELKSQTKSSTSGSSTDSSSTSDPTA